MKEVLHRILVLFRKRKIAALLPNIGKDYTFGKRNTIIGGKNIFIGDCFSGNDELRIEAITCNQNETCSPEIRIGNNVSVGMYCHIACINRVIIQDGVLIGSKVLITDHMHGNIGEEMEKKPVDRRLFSKGSVIIEENVWIGDGVCVMPNVKIGKNSIIGANAVVTKNIPSNSVAVGIPAKVIRKISK